VSLKDVFLTVFQMCNTSFQLHLMARKGDSVAATMDALLGLRFSDGGKESI
jgi:hypothetical protein